MVLAEVTEVNHKKEIKQQNLLTWVQQVVLLLKTGFGLQTVAHIDQVSALPIVVYNPQG